MSREFEEASQAFLWRAFDLKLEDSRQTLTVLEQIVAERSKTRTAGRERGRATRDVFVEIGSSIFGSVIVLRDATRSGDPVLGMHWATVDGLGDRLWKAVTDFADSSDEADMLRQEIVVEAERKVAGFQPTADAKVRDLADRYLTGQRRVTEKSGCYVATSVYGTYDCPELWVLRRFRDQVLLPRRLGRIAVSIYYAISPSLIRYGGKATPALARGPVEVLVAALRRQGLADTPYVDVQPPTSGQLQGPGRENCGGVVGQGSDRT